MMRRTVFALACFLIGLGVAAFSVEWTEIQAFSAVAADPATGAPSVSFSLSLPYDKAPDRMQIRAVWEIYVWDDGAQILLDSYTRRSVETQGMLLFYVGSSPVLIETGKRYVANLVVDDLVNGLHHEHVFDFLAPLSLPIGIHFEGDDGEEEWDLTSLPDEELEELVLLYQLVTAEYELAADGVALDSMFADYAGDEASFPMAVLLIPTEGLSTELGLENSPISVTVAQMLYVYSIPSADAIGGFEDQVEQFQRDFVGFIYTGPGGEGLGAGSVIFLHEPVWSLLEDVSAEYARRTE